MAALQAGDLILKKYRIVKLIGRGTFAEVWLAMHLELRSPRAIKVLHRNTAGLDSLKYQDYTERFKLEAMLGGRINNPNVVRVYDFERDGDTLLLVMEYCPGGSLADLLLKLKQQNTGLKFDHAVRFGIQVADGLAALHQMEAVHRDLKPSNILFDAAGNAKVADLGLVEMPGDQRSQLSQPPDHLGTPGYMSPEQGTSRDILPRSSDVYALGLVLFEALSGQSYIRLRTGSRRLSRLRKNTPRWLDNLLLRMLAENPQARPWDGAEAAKLLRQGQARLPDWLFWFVGAGVLGLVSIALISIALIAGLLISGLLNNPNVSAISTGTQPAVARADTQTPTVTSSATPEPPQRPTNTIVPTDVPPPPTDTSVPPVPTTIPTKSLPTIQIPFSDNFASGISPPWKVENGKWIISDGRATIVYSDQGGWGFVVLDDSQWTNYKVAVNYKLEKSDEGNIAIIIRKPNTNRNLLVFYVINVLNQGGFATYDGVYFTPVTGLVSVSSFDYEGTIEITANGNNFTATVNGMIIQSISMSGYENGGVGLGIYCYAQPCASFGNFEVTTP